MVISVLSEAPVFAKNRPVKSPALPANRPFPSAVELVLSRYGELVDGSRASDLAFHAALSAMAPATRAALTSDLKCFLNWCASQRPAEQSIPARPEAIVHYLQWLARGSENRAGAKPATLSRRLASIARAHRMLGFGDTEPLPTQAGMVKDTLKGLRREKRQRQRQAAPLRLGDEMGEGQGAPTGPNLRALLAACGTDLPGLRDAALFSTAYDAGLRVSELVATTVSDLSRMPDGTGRLEIQKSKTDQTGEGALAWLSAETMTRLSEWLGASGINKGPVFRRINRLTSKPDRYGQQVQRQYLGGQPLTRQGVVAILRRRLLQAIDLGLLELEPGTEGDVARSISAHSFRVGLAQDLFAAGEDGAGIALALRWSSPTTALRYARELAVGSNAAARVLGRVRGDSPG